MFRLVTIVSVATAGVLAIALPGASQSAQPAISSEELGHVRVERSVVLDEPWRSTAGGATAIFSETVRLPSSADEFDVVVSATLEARTSSNDRVELSATYHVESGLPHPPGLLPPGPFSVMSARARTARTALWSGTLAGTGDPVTFSLHARAVDGRDDNHSARASGRKLTMVIELWPAGP